MTNDQPAPDHDHAHGWVDESGFEPFTGEGDIDEGALG